MIPVILARSLGLMGQCHVVFRGQKLVNRINSGRVCSFAQNETTILVLKNVQFEFRQVLRHYRLL